MQAAFDAIVLKQVATEIGNIRAEYRGVVPEESIDLVARQSLQNLANSKVPQFVPLFVGRFTLERLHEHTGFRPRVKFNLLTRWPPRAGERLFPGGVPMIHALLVLAVILFVLWLLFHATGGLVNLIWLVIIVLVGLWLFGFVRSRSAR
jgi:hypothetical protein